MRKFCFFLSVISHILGIALLTRIHFQIKIPIIAPTVIDISLRQPETAPQAPLIAPDSAIWEKQGLAATALPGSEFGSGSSPSSRSSPQGGLPASGMQANFPLFAASGRLKLKSAPASEFSLVMPVSKPFITSTLAATYKNGKWLLPEKYAAGTYPGGMQFEAINSQVGISYQKIPFNIQNKEAALWTQNVLARIERNWIIPTTARVGLLGQVGITLTVDHSGQLLSLVVNKSSAQEELEQAALNAMKNSLPFPPLPENISAQTLVFHFIFNYNA